jgi:hypothetical protein
MPDTDVTHEQEKRFDAIETRLDVLEDALDIQPVRTEEPDTDEATVFEEKEEGD